MSDKLTNFGYGFQIKVVSSLLTDKAFLQQVTDILLPDFFESEANQWIVETINKYFNLLYIYNNYCQSNLQEMIQIISKAIGLLEYFKSKYHLK